MDIALTAHNPTYNESPKAPARHWVNVPRLGRWRLGRIESSLGLISSLLVAGVGSFLILNGAELKTKLGWAQTSSAN